LAFGFKTLILGGTFYMTKKIIGLILIVVLLSGLCGLVSADDSTAVLPTLKLTVGPSPLAICPPAMMYTAQLSFMPQPTSTTPLKADFYNITSPMGPIMYLGSAYFDSTGKAVLNKQIDPGIYTAQASTVIYNTTIKSNTVTYKVP
jgi:hypothetical protein